MKKHYINKIDRFSDLIVTYTIIVQGDKIMKEKNKVPFLTIGIASYNYSKYLRPAFEAIKRQSFNDFEVLYCDDGSTDDSVEVIKTIIKENPDMKIRLVEGKNSGVMGNKNRIIENSVGKYLMLCDADDKMLPNCLEVLCGMAKKTDADQIIGAFEQTDENGKIIQIQEIPKKAVKWTWGAHHATLYKTKIIKDNNLKFDKNCFPDDVYFNMIFHDKSKTTEFINEVVYEWNMHADSTSATKNVEDKWHGYSLLKSALSYIVPICETYAKEDRQQIEYMGIKIYCLSVLYRNTESFKAFINGYKKMRKLMEIKFPYYRKNIYAKKVDALEIVRKPTAKIIWAFIVAEKTHLINMVLLGYWFISRFKKFTV